MVIIFRPSSIRVFFNNGRVITVAKYISFILDISIYKSLQLRIVIPAPEVVHPGFFVPDIAPVPEGIEIPQRACHRPCGGLLAAPGIVGVLYHGVPGAIKDGQDIPLQVMDIAVHRAVVLHLRRPVLPVVVEVQGMAARHRHVYDVIAAEHIICHRAAALLLHPQAVSIAFVFHRAAAVGLAGQLSARLPGIGPSGVGGDVADGVADHGIGDPIDHASGQLVLPVGVPKLILFRMDGRARVSSVDTTIGSRIIILIATQVYAPPKLNKLFLSLLSLFCIPF